MKFDFSIVIATYNPDYQKLFYTINSVVNQQNCEYEIIITDDGSKNFDVEQIKKYFKKIRFEKYLIIDNKNNEGTVKNFIKGLNSAKGDYIKLLSPGDYLYSDMTLCNLKKYICENNVEVLFGKAVYYYIKENKIMFEKKSNPRNTKMFNNKNSTAKLLKNYIFFQDYILGASTVCERKLLISYLERLSNKIIYLEDLSYLYMLVDGIKIFYYDKFIVWYECSTGISNNDALGFTEKNRKDIITCNKEITEKNPRLKKYTKYYFDEKYMNSTVFIIKRKIYNKYYVLKKQLFDVDYKTIDINNYNKIIKK